VNRLLYKEKQTLEKTKCSIFVLEGVLPWLKKIMIFHLSALPARPAASF
jgi:hypothetical protein